MSRPLKRGLDYFPLDIDFFDDPKIEFVTARFDEKGELITIKLLCAIYRNGYYTDWNDDKALLFSKRAGRNTSPSLVNDVVMELVKRGFFDRSIFDSFSVLTSRGIQKRFLYAISDRKDVEILADYWLLDLPENSQRVSYSIIGGENEIKHSDNPIEHPNNAQSKVKKRKEKNICANDFFEEAWKIYPRKLGKGKLSQKQKEKLFSLGDSFVTAVKRYSEKVIQDGTPEQFIMHGSTFFNSGYVDYLTENFQPQPEAGKPNALPEERDDF